MRVRLTQLDGKLPNIALAALYAHHAAAGDEIHFTRNAGRDLFEGEYDRVYGSAIFTRSGVLVERLKRDFPEAIVGGTGTGDWTTVEQSLGLEGPLPIDYAPWPEYQHSIGFLARGCRLACKFCVVPKKEGRPRSEATLADLWRGEPYPKNIVLLDNDFFGNPEWEARVREIADGGYRVCFNQGINVRLIKDESATVLATLPFYDDSFTKRQLYTAWDNLKDEGIFTAGIDRLTKAGIAASSIMVYMLVGFDQEETWERIFHRFDVMQALGVMAYPMVYESFPGSPPSNALEFRMLKHFQRWVIGRFCELYTFAEYCIRKGDAPPDATDSSARLRRKRARRAVNIAERTRQKGLFTA